MEFLYVKMDTQLREKFRAGNWRQNEIRNSRKIKDRVRKSETVEKSKKDQESQKQSKNQKQSKKVGGGKKSRKRAKTLEKLRKSGRDIKSEEINEISSIIGNSANEMCLLLSEMAEFS